MNTYYFNTARNALRALLRTEKIKEIYIPYEICPVIIKAVKAENVRINFYHIDDNFLPILKSTNNPLFYPNYLGICDKQVNFVEKNFPNLIYDAVQSFFTEPKGIASIYSLRKFFPVPDGAILKTQIEICNNYPIELDIEPFSLNSLNFDYEKFLINERRFDNSNKIKGISNISKKLFSQIDIEVEQKQRCENFKTLHEIFASSNLIKIDDIPCSPFVYPLKTTDKNVIKTLVNSNIFLLKYNYLKNIIPIPLDSIERIRQLFPYHLSS